MFLKLGPRSKRSREGRAGASQGVLLASMVPNFITTLALCSGLAALHFVLREQWERALFAILLAAIFDALDGRAARFFRVSSRFGAMLDSLSDFLAFGVAPALVIMRWVLDVGTPEPGRTLGERLLDGFALASVMAFAVCAALRLARFTAAALAPAPATQRPAKESSLFFTGMPTPAAAGAVLVPALWEASHLFDWRPPAWAVCVYTLAIALLMISRVPMFSLKGVRVPRPFVAPLFVLLVLGVVGMIKDTWLTIALLAIAYVASIPFSVALRSRLRAQAREQPSGAPAP